MINEIENKKSFQDVIAKNEPQTIIFYQETCGTCKRYFDLLETLQFDEPNFHKVDIHSDIDYYRYQVKLAMLFPDTRIYKCRVLLYRRSGIHFGKQLRELKEVIVEHAPKTEI